MLKINVADTIFRSFLSTAKKAKFSTFIEQIKSTALTNVTKGHQYYDNFRYLAKLLELKTCSQNDAVLMGT